MQRLAHTTEIPIQPNCYLNNLLISIRSYTNITLLEYRENVYGYFSVIYMKFSVTVIRFIMSMGSKPHRLPDTCVRTIYIKVVD